MSIFDPIAQRKTSLFQIWNLLWLVPNYEVTLSLKVFKLRGIFSLSEWVLVQLVQGREQDPFRTGLLVLFIFHYWGMAHSLCQDILLSQNFTREWILLPGHLGPFVRCFEIPKLWSQQITAYRPNLAHFGFCNKALLGTTATHSIMNLCMGRFLS